MIREVQNQSPLFQTTALGGLAGAGGGSSGECGLTTSGKASFIVPTNDTGSVAVNIQVCSSVAQSVTLVASFAGPQPSCLGTPTVTPSTFTFTAGQCAPILVTVPYTNCSSSFAGAGFTISLVGTTSTGCVTGNLLSNLPGGGEGTVTNAPIFQVQVECIGGSSYSGSCSGQTTTGANIGCNCNNFSPCGAGPKYLTCGCCGCINGGISVQVCSKNGFAGTVTLSCSGVTCAGFGDSYGCNGVSASVTLTAGNCASAGSISPCSNVTGNGQGSTFAAISSAYTISGTTNSGNPADGSGASATINFYTVTCP